jgi:hypothetical protein
MAVKVTELTVTSIAPKVKNPAFQKYLPTRLLPEHISFVVSPVSNAVSNAIRRTVGCELLVARMAVAYDNLHTTDIFIIPEMVIKRLRMIPIDQACPRDAIFELYAQNNTAVVRDIKSGEMTAKGVKSLPFNGTFTLFTLNPGKSIKITGITINTAYGFVAGDGMHALGINPISVAVDQQPINTFEPDNKGIPSRISNPRVYRIAFNTNGDMPARAIVAAACDNIIARVQSITELLHSITSNAAGADIEYWLAIPGEGDTIGNLVMRTALDLFPDITVVYTVANIGRSASLRIQCGEDINTVYNTVIKHLVKVFREIKSNFD